MASHEIGLPARQEDAAHHRQDENDQEGRILQTASVHPDEGDDADAGGVQCFQQTSMLTDRCESSQRREPEVDRAQRK
jgi:hypothetical protein